MPMGILEQRTVEFALKSAQESLALADKQNQELSEESRKQYDVYYDKVLLYSAGAFSFCITLIGLVLSNKAVAMAKIGLWIPNIFWLYISLGLYLITCSLILVARRADAAYSGAFGMHNWTEKKKAEQEARKAFLNTHRGQVSVTNGGNEDSEIVLCDENIQRLISAVKKNKQDRDFHYNLKFWCHRIAEITVIIATLLLFFFTIQMMQAIVWG